MPIYEYECESCRNRTEVNQKISDPPLERCEACGGSLRKLISSPGIMFKGSGWYVTDYSGKLKEPGKKEGEKKEAAPAKTEGGSAEKSKETPKKDSGSK